MNSYETKASTSVGTKGITDNSLEPSRYTHILINSLGVVNGDVIIRDNTNGSVSVSELDILLANLSYHSTENWETSIQDIAFRKDSDHFKHIGVRHAKSEAGSITLDDVQLNINNGLLKLDAKVHDIATWASWKDVQAQCRPNIS